MTLPINIILILCITGKGRGCFLDNLKIFYVDSMFMLCQSFVVLEPITWTIGSAEELGFGININLLSVKDLVGCGYRRRGRKKDFLKMMLRDEKITPS